MICIALQEYVNIRSDSAVSSVTQNESGWIDVGGFQDIVAFLEVREFSGATTITISYQTSPTRGDESLWVNMTGAVTLVAGLTTTKMLKTSATVPVARFVRWQLGASGITGSWDAYFRVWLACNRAGKRNTIALAPDTRGRMLASEPSIPLTRRTSNGPSITYAGSTFPTPGASMGDPTGYNPGQGGSASRGP